mgnify:CR=1 FL=1
MYKILVPVDFSEKSKYAVKIAAQIGKKIDANEAQKPISDELYYIVPDKCTECVGFHDEPQCASVCPVDCCIPDENNVETEEQLLAKKAWMHGE